MHERLMGSSLDPDSSSPQASAEDLNIALEQMVRYVRRSATAGGLSTAASSALGRLGREGPQRLTELARAENVSQPNMTQLVTRMERAGLVRRTADRTDGRGVLVEATDTGLEVFRQRRAERARALGRLVGELSEAERHAVRIALPALARAIAENHPNAGTETSGEIRK
ncbi:MarR family winged helix-turn-helix transcriptional regulator [Streptomyces sp. NRRL S-340]|uniref:MarR family winged helix-turn-helix transcriptional regulator n=1 Tax=Streptomyces sp. NRRL S-340 TaxID=1463901 RepID=UPI00068E3D0F|nr:MarR family transcriptional regulator [Streptomyces sp. NRRL S-340]